MADWEKNLDIAFRRAACCFAFDVPNAASEFPMNLMQATCKRRSFEMGRVTSLGPRGYKPVVPPVLFQLARYGMEPIKEVWVVNMHFPRTDSHDGPLRLLEFHRQLKGKETTDRSVGAFSQSQRCTFLPKGTRNETRTSQ
jgi:hypothetical protein